MSKTKAVAYRSSLEELRGRVQPALDEVRNGMRPTKGGISYLEAKHLLLLSYCQNLAFYLLLKLEGREVRDHPVMERLVEIRTYLEKAKPIDKRMQHQIDRVIRIAKSADAPKPKQADGEEDESDEGELDDLAYRPNPEALVPKETEQDTDAAYRPPKLAPAAPVDEPSVAREKAERETAEATRRAHRSRLVRFLSWCLPKARDERVHPPYQPCRCRFVSWSKRLKTSLKRNRREARTR